MMKTKTKPKLKNKWKTKNKTKITLLSSYLTYLVLHVTSSISRNLVGHNSDNPGSIPTDICISMMFTWCTCHLLLGIFLLCTFYSYDHEQVTWLVITEVRSKSFALVILRRHYNACPIYANCSSVRPAVCFIAEFGIAHFLCTYARYVHIRRSGIILTP